MKGEGREGGIEREREGERRRKGGRERERVDIMRKGARES